MPADVAGAVHIVTSIEELLGEAAERTPMKTGDSLSGSRFERVRIDGRRRVVKYICPEDDWIARATGDCGERQLALWRSPLATRLPTEIDCAVVACAPYATPSGRPGVALLLDDVSDDLVPEGSVPLDDTDHMRFLEHMAALHARFWGFVDSPATLMPTSHHYLFLSPTMAALETLRGTEGVPAQVGPAWGRFGALAPPAAPIVLPLLSDPTPLVEALAATPSTLVHGDWKLGNLGSRPDGRTILLDWDRTGSGPATLDLAWYLAVNCDRMRLTKEAAIDAYRNALERCGIDTSSWWDRQLGLALLGAFVQLGWAKVGGDATELAWWVDRAQAAAPLLR